MLRAIDIKLLRELGRQRGQIASIAGYKNRQVGMHYLGLVAIVLLPGGAHFAATRRRLPKSSSIS
jgi:hypothetical protein